MTNAIWEDLKLLFAHFHLAPKVVCLRERLSIVSIPSFRAMVNIFCLEKESGYILEISESFPKGTDFICNGVWRNLSLRILLKTVRGMVIKKNGRKWQIYWGWKQKCYPASLPGRARERDSWEEYYLGQNKSQILIVPSKEPKFDWMDLLSNSCPGTLLKTKKQLAGNYSSLTAWCGQWMKELKRLLLNYCQP